MELGWNKVKLQAYKSVKFPRIPVRSLINGGLALRLFMQLPNVI